jgi:competence protein ComEA
MTVSRFQKLRPYLIVTMVNLLIVGCAYLLIRRPALGSVEVLLPSTPTPAATSTPAMLRVYITGAVRSPDVYVLAPGSIVKDAILAAGGAGPDADLLQVNLALELQDQMQIVVPRRGETVATPGSAPAARSAPSLGTTPGRVNVNTASAEVLESLPGIGPGLAGRIVDGRPYRKIEDLLSVPGIGEKTYEELKDLVSVN